MATGTVKWFSTEKGYGFIAPEDGGNDIFVHITALQRANIPNLAEGQKVSYELVSNNKGRTSADNLQLAD